MKTISTESAGAEAAWLAMALLLLASLKAAGGAALLPLPYYLALVAAVAMVLRLSRPRLLARRAHQRAELLRVLPLAWPRRPRSNRIAVPQHNAIFLF